MTYEDLQAVLDSLGSAVGAAEAHGCLCGALCARAGYATAEWAGELIDGEVITGLDEHSQAVLGSLHEQTLEALQSQDFGFAPLVPDDAAALEARVEALAAWCGGFLYGVGAGGAGMNPGAIGEVGEVLQDLGEIARARLDLQEAARGGQEAFAELFEYLRAAVQLALDELAALRAAHPDARVVVH